MQFQKIKSPLSKANFIAKAKELKKFISSQGKNYSVTEIDGDIMKFIRVDSSPNVIWDIDLVKLYNAYINLENYPTKSFIKYVPRRHSPGRGILIKLGLIGYV
ncbi:hypothetical protein [Mucilaginibacter flavidus]|uniref:hypothetical protein n=1 Tax=Mucilaginibacter flavidus TaxID=2949309 RepID=UPI002093D482|nr:hypothetical protein [Mucilaginibacter flavidus]MCO5948447.1 hypothetical protein [Mucilaginibacter flavidus]